MPLQLHDTVRLSIQAELARIGMLQNQLARLLGEGPSWVNRRLNGATPITFEDLDRMATAMGWTAEEVLLGDTR